MTEISSGLGLAKISRNSIEYAVTETNSGLGLTKVGQKFCMLKNLQQHRQTVAWALQRSVEINQCQGLQSWTVWWCHSCLIPEGKN